MADQTLDLGPYLAKLEAQRDTITIQIAGVRDEMGLPPEAGGIPARLSGSISPTGTVSTRVNTGHVRSDEFFRMSIPEAVKRYLEIMKQPQSPTDIAAALKKGGVLSESKNFYTTVWTAIKRLKAKTEIVNTANGWGLADWYRNRSKGNEDKPAKKAPAKKGKAKGSKGRRKASKMAPKATETASPARAGGNLYTDFMAAQRKAGKTMQEISAAWKKQKAGA
jgi:hypothetical protein